MYNNTVQRIYLQHLLASFLFSEHIAAWNIQSSSDYFSTVVWVFIPIQMIVQFQMHWLTVALVLACLLQHSLQSSDVAAKYEGKVIKGNRNALFLVNHGQRTAFPDFYTFTQMGFNMSVIAKIPDVELNAIPMGPMIKAIPVYRGEDFMYHRVCSDVDRLVSELC